MGLSPTPIREAVRRLSSENAIEVLGNRRLRLPEMTPGRFEELVRLRIALETHAATRAFPWLSDIAIARLAGSCRMDAALAARDLDGLTRLNEQFHKPLYGAQSRPGGDSADRQRLAAARPLPAPCHRASGRRGTAHHHKAMLEAMRARDLDALCAAIERDVQDGPARAGCRLLRDPAEAV